MSLSDLSQLTIEPDVSIIMSMLKQLLSWCVLSVSVAACGPNDGYQAPFANDARPAAEIAQSIYELEHGDSYPQCVSDAKLGQFAALAPGDLGVRCGAAYGTSEACFYQYDIHGPRFAILSTMKDDKATQVHEYLHYYLQCNFDDADSLHYDGVWHRMGEDWVIGTGGEARE